MNNKSDKKHKPKPKTKKKTASHQFKKKIEIKTGGAGWFKGLFSEKTGSYNSKTQPPANSRTLSPNVSQTQPPANLNNSQQNVLPVNSNNSQPQPPPPPPPNAQPQGLNTIKSTSRCSIL